jgi:hypothetical protein
MLKQHEVQREFGTVKKGALQLKIFLIFHSNFSFTNT